MKQVKLLYIFLLFLAANSLLLTPDKYAIDRYSTRAGDTALDMFS